MSISDLEDVFSDWLTLFKMAGGSKSLTVDISWQTPEIDKSIKMDFFSVPFHFRAIIHATTGTRMSQLINFVN